MSRLIDAEKLTHYLAVNEDDKQFFYVKSKDIDRLSTLLRTGCLSRQRRGDSNSFMRQFHSSVRALYVF